MTERHDRLHFTGTVLALVGWAFGLVTFLVLLADNHFEIGTDMAAYLRAGESFVAGEPVYVGQIGELGVFSYAPPWAVLFGALSWVPGIVMQAGIMVLGLISIRYVAGSWLWSGLEQRGAASVGHPILPLEYLGAQPRMPGGVRGVHPRPQMQ